MLNITKTNIMIFSKDFVYLGIVLTISIFLFLPSSCTGDSNSKEDILKEHMSDSAVAHVPILVKRSKKEFDNEPIKQDKNPIFKAKQYEVDIEQSELEWFCSKHTGFVEFKSGIFNRE